MDLAQHTPRVRIQASTDVLIVTYLGLLLLFFMFTVGANWKYSVDLQVLKDVAGIYPFANDPAGALADNSFLVWISLAFGPVLAVNTTLASLYVLAFALKTALLLRYFGLSATLALTLLFFFSVDLNQARLSLCLSMLLLAWHTQNQRRTLRAAIFVVLGVLFHYPAGATLLAFYFVTRYPTATFIAAGAAGIGAVVAMFSEDSPLIRYLIYFNVDSDNSTASSFYLITLSLVLIYWKRLSKVQAVIALSAVLVSFVARDLVNLSGRLAELTALCVATSSFIMGGHRRELVRRSNLFLLIAAAFFLYRFNQWVIQGNMPMPSNL